MGKLGSLNDMSGEDGWEATVAKSALVRWWWVFVVERKVSAGMLALQRSGQ